MNTTLAPLVFMYVFFDHNGEIKAIAPTLDENLSTSYSTASFPLSEVEVFLRAQRNAFDYKVNVSERPGGKIYKIVKKIDNINYVKTLDSYLTKIEDVKSSNAIIVTNNTLKKFVSVEIVKDFKAAYEQNTEDDNVYSFFNSGISSIYLTKKNNPYHLLFTVSFIPRELLVSDILYFNYTGSYNSSSAYTKKLINGYGYREKAE